MEGIERCTHFLLLYSWQSCNSKHTQRETHNAVDQDKIIIPVRIDDAPINTFFRYYIATNHWLDFTDGRLAQQPHLLLDFIRETAEQRGEPVSPATRRKLSIDSAVVWSAADLEDDEGESGVEARQPPKPAEVIELASGWESSPLWSRWQTKAGALAGLLLLGVLTYFFALAPEPNESAARGSSLSGFATEEGGVERGLPAEADSQEAESPELALSHREDLSAAGDGLDTDVDAAALASPSFAMADAGAKEARESDGSIQVSGADGAEEQAASAPTTPQDPYRLTDSVLRGICRLGGMEYRLTVVLPSASLQRAKVIFVDGDDRSRAVEGEANFFDGGVVIKSSSPALALDIAWEGERALRAAVSGELGANDAVELKQVMRFLK